MSGRVPASPADTMLAVCGFSVVVDSTVVYERPLPLQRKRSLLSELLQAPPSCDNSHSEFDEDGGVCSSVYSEDLEEDMGEAEGFVNIDKDSNLTDGSYSSLASSELSSTVSHPIPIPFPSRRKWRELSERQRLWLLHRQQQVYKSTRVTNSKQTDRGHPKVYVDNYGAVRRCQGS